MNYEDLQALLKEEEEDEERFSALPFQWLEISAAVLDWSFPVFMFCSRISATDDVVEPDLTRRLLRDLREIRQAKSRKGLEQIEATHLRMDNLGMMEICEIRFLSQTLDRLRTLSVNKVDQEEDVNMEESAGFGSVASAWDD